MRWGARLFGVCSKSVGSKIKRYIENDIFTGVINCNGGRYCSSPCREKIEVETDRIRMRKTVIFITVLFFIQKRGLWKIIIWHFNIVSVELRNDSPDFSVLSTGSPSARLFTTANQKRSLSFFYSICLVLLPQD